MIAGIRPLRAAVRGVEMFDTMVASHAPAARRTRTVVITASVVVHAVAVTALVVAAMWNIDKLELDPRGVTVSSLTLPGDSGGGGMPKAAALVPKAEPRKIVPKDTVQPVEDVPKIEQEPEPTAEASREGAGTLGGTIPGNGTGGDGRGVGTPTDGAGCKQPPCGEGTDDGTEKPKAKIQKKAEPLVISPKVAAGLRVSGNDRIAAPDSVRAAMLRENKERVMGTAKLCIGADGRIDRASMLRSTGYDAYDAKLLGEMRLWRYRPYKVDGVAAPACTVVTVVYIMKD